MNNILPASPAFTVNTFCLPRYAFFRPIPLLVTLLASDLNRGKTGPACFDLEIFCTVSTTIELVSCAPLSARSAPIAKFVRLLTWHCT